MGSVEALLQDSYFIHWLENQMIPEKQSLGYINAVFSLKYDAQTKAINESSILSLH